MSDYNRIFTNPAPYGDMKFNGEYEVKLLSYPGSKLAAPENGVIIEPLKPYCENSIQIKHKIDERYVTSVFCGIDDVMVSHGDKVKKNMTIGKFGDDKIMYYIINEEGKKVKIEKYFTSAIPSRVTDTEKEKEEKKKKEELEKKSKELEKKNKEKNRPENDAHNVFVDLMLLPFSGLKSTSNKVKNQFNQDKDEKDKKLNESISRIKNLLK